MSGIEILIDTDEIARDIHKYAKAESDRRAKMIADSVIADHFRGFGTYKNATCGFGYGAIREMIDEMLLKPEFKARIERKAEAIFEEYFEKALHEAAERAARKAAYMATQKQLDRKTEELNNVK